MRGRRSQYVQGLPVGQRLIGEVIVDLADRLGNRTVSSAGLTTNGALARAGSAFHTLLRVDQVGRIFPTAANTDMPALSGTVVNATHNVFVYSMDNSGTRYTQMGIAGASLATVTFPEIPAGRAVIGYTHINPTGTGNFVGGTTTFADATVVPNAVHVNVIGPFDPSLIP